MGRSVPTEGRQRLVDLKPSGSSTTIAPQKDFVVQGVNNVIKLRYGDVFQQPGFDHPKRHPTSDGITRSVDTKIIRAKLRTSAYVPPDRTAEGRFRPDDAEHEDFINVDYRHTKDA